MKGSSSEGSLQWSSAITELKNPPLSRDRGEILVSVKSMIVLERLTGPEFHAGLLKPLYPTAALLLSVNILSGGRNFPFVSI